MTVNTTHTLTRPERPAVIAGITHWVSAGLRVLQAVAGMVGWA